MRLLAVLVLGLFAGALAVRLHDYPAPASHKRAPLLTQWYVSLSCAMSDADATQRYAPALEKAAPQLGCHVGRVVTSGRVTILKLACIAPATQSQVERAVRAAFGSLAGATVAHGLNAIPSSAPDEVCTKPPHFGVHRPLN